MDAQQIAQVRRFNRVVTQRVGALEDSYLARGRPLGQARLLFEIGPEGAELRGLRDRLRLDSGYLSRLLRALEEQGLVAMEASGDDARGRRVALTPAGLAEHAAYESGSQDFAATLLAALAPAERERLVKAMAEVEALLEASVVTIAFERPDTADAIACLSAYFAELDRRFQGGFDPGAPVERLAEGLAADGHFLMARREGRPIGCVALVPLDEATGEIKRLWIDASARGAGLSRRLMERMEDKARALSLTRLVLDTNRTLAEAQALYRRLGYQQIGRYNDNPYADHFFEKRLA